MGNRFESLFTNKYEADYKVINKNDKVGDNFGYEELHLTDDLIDRLKAGKDLDISIQDEYCLRLIYEPGEPVLKVEGNTFESVFHMNKHRYSNGMPIVSTPKAGQAQDGKMVPLLYNHEHNNPSSVLGYAEIEFDEPTHSLVGLCRLNDAARVLLDTDELYSLDTHLTNLKYSSSGNLCNFVVREVSLVRHDALPDHPAIRFI